VLTEFADSKLKRTAACWRTLEIDTFFAEDRNNWWRRWNEQYLTMQQFCRAGVGLQQAKRCT